MDQPFTVTRLPHGVTMISDPAVHCFLVEGTRRAVLIDAMTGLRGLAALLPALTSLPVEVVATHGHIDHIGGVFELGGCALHPADAGLLDGQSLPARVAFMEDWTRRPWPRTAFVPDRPVNLRPLADGDTFDLGGRRLEVIGVPGHTRGSVCLLDPDSGDFFAGDACNDSTLLVMPNSTPVSEYLAALERLKTRQAQITSFYVFHGPTPVDKSCIDDNIQNCKDILAGTDDHIPTLHHGHWYYLAKEREREIFRRKDGKFGNILYARAR